MIFILKTDFEEVLNNFFRYKGDGFKKDNYILRFVHDTLPNDIKSHIDDNYKVVGSVGKGTWADCPTVAILDNDITKSTQNGIYLVYLFKSDMSGIYLSFAWGSYQFNNDKDKLHEAVEDIRKLLIDSDKIDNSELNKTMDLVSNALRPKSYEAGAIVFKYYSLENFPDDEILINDLNEYLEIYDFVKKNYNGTYSDFLKEAQPIDTGSSGGTGDDDIPNKGSNEELPKYDYTKFLEEVYIDENDYNTLVTLLTIKKNIIIQGAPGVGKTFMAKRLAYSIIGEKNQNQVMMVQFHQSYSYEDFVMGYRPSKEGFELRDGSFYSFCKAAKENPEKEYFFIIDEINRGNLSKIFGELFMLIENDKRGEKNKIRLLYINESFFIPKNIHIIGLMNTADRSLAMIDYALRRRFAFFDLKPGFDSNGFSDYQNQLNNEKFNKMVELMKELNQEIKEDESLGEGFRIGHSYLCNIKLEDIDERLNFIVEYELIPLLKEYWFDELEKVERWSEKLRSVINDST